MAERKRILFDDSEKGSDWVVSYYLGEQEFDDSFDELNRTEIILTAESFEIAVRYAQQYLRKMKSEDETSAEWANAEILSIELY